MADTNDTGDTQGAQTRTPEPKKVHVSLEFVGAPLRLTEVAYLTSLRSGFIVIGKSGLELFGPAHTDPRLSVGYADFKADPVFCEPCNVDLADAQRTLHDVDVQPEDLQQVVSHVACRAPTRPMEFCQDILGSVPECPAHADGTKPGRHLGLLSSWTESAQNIATKPLLLDAMRFQGRLQYDSDSSVLAPVRYHVAGQAPRSGHHLSEHFVESLSRRFPDVVVIGHSICEDDQTGRSLLYVDGALRGVFEFGDFAPASPYAGLAKDLGSSYARVSEGLTVFNPGDMKLEDLSKFEYDESTGVYRDPVTGEGHIPYGTATSTMQRRSQEMGFLLRQDLKAANPGAAEFGNLSCPEGAVSLLERSLREGPAALASSLVAAEGGNSGSPVEILASTRQRSGFTALDASLCVSPEDALSPEACTARGLAPPVSTHRKTVAKLFSTELVETSPGSDASGAELSDEDRAVLQVAEEVIAIHEELSDGARGILDPHRVECMLEICARDTPEAQALRRLLSDPKSQLANGQHVLSLLVTHVARMNSQAADGAWLYAADGSAFPYALSASGLDAVLREVAAANAANPWLRVTVDRIAEYLASGRSASSGVAGDVEIDLAVALCTLPSSVAWDLAVSAGVPTPFIARCASERPDSLRLYAESWAPAHGLPGGLDAFSQLVPTLGAEAHPIYLVNKDTGVSLHDYTLSSYFCLSAQARSSYSREAAGHFSEVGPSEVRLHRKRRDVIDEVERLALRENMLRGIAEGRKVAAAATESAPVSAQAASVPAQRSYPRL